VSRREGRVTVSLTAALAAPLLAGGLLLAGAAAASRQQPSPDVEPPAPEEVFDERKATFL